MTQFFKTLSATALLAAMTAVPALADLVRIPPGMQVPPLAVDGPVAGSILFDCHLSGAEFANDLFVVRVSGPTSPGTTIGWRVGQFQGISTLPALAAGQGHVIQNAFPGALGHGTPCTAAVN